MSKQRKVPTENNQKEKETIRNQFLIKKETKKQILAEEHHRRPRSLQGSSSPANIAYVPSEKHKSWHVLVGNMNAYQIANYLNECAQKPKNLLVVCEFINGVEVIKKGENNSKNQNKIKKAWNLLFDECENFEQIIAYINNTLLDPAYHLYVQKIWCIKNCILQFFFYWDAIKNSSVPHSGGSVKFFYDVKIMPTIPVGELRRKVLLSLFFAFYFSTIV